MAERAAPDATSRPRIALLDEGTVAGIAAGEVVERPASAVKELVENALDAGATRVRVDYDDKAGTRIVVTDDGAGIPEAEVELALTRHATSKIRTLADLDAVSTFGFRGEALAAIASASDLEITTAVEGALGGVRVTVKAGRIVERAPSASRRGTTIEVRDLFATVPARRKFLKSATAESGFVADVVRRFALARPDVQFTLALSGRVSLDVAPVATAAERMRQVLGKEVSVGLVEVDARYGGFHLHGLVSPPGTAYGSSRRMALFVGRRWVKDRLLFQAVLEGYQTYLLKGRYPAVSLFLDVEGAAVDVNVHPAKLEVRFADADEVRRFVAEGVRDALRRSSSPLGRWGIDATEALRRRAVPTSAPSGGFVDPSGLGSSGARDQRARERAMEAASAPAPAETGSWRDASFSAEAGSYDEDAASAPGLAGSTADVGIPGYQPAGPIEGAKPTDGVQASLDLGPERAEDALGRLEIVGQIFDGYFVCEGDGEVLLIDQHAGHERVLFERLMLAFEQREVARQALLLPERVHVGAAGVEACALAQGDLEALGWEIEPFGEEDVVVRAVPAMAVGTAVAPLVEAVAADLVAVGHARAAERLAERIMATVACHSAVRVGQRLGAAAARALLREMAAVPYHATCPHGRPVARKLSRGQVERMFGR